MKKFALTILLVFLLISSSFAAGQNVAATYHLSFEDFAFLDECFVARSGFKTIEKRGLTLEKGRFGKGIRMNIIPGYEDIDNLSGLELDPIVGAIFIHKYMKGRMVGYNEPLLWGAGKLNSSSGAVSFWVKGKLSEGLLFNQSACAWGRKEQFLIAIEVNKTGGLEAYLEDSRYVRHTIKSYHLWDENIWNHITLNWDKSQGLELFINGKSAASSWGKDAWWETAYPGLLQFPMPKVIYDEMYFFNRPLTRKEIETLIVKNTPPAYNPTVKERTNNEHKRLARALGLSTKLHLPVIKPLEENKVLSFKEITPKFIGDEKIPARFCNDGRYELAWPHPIAIFTIIPGDVDYMAEKMDVEPPEGIPFNYITIEGNLNGLPVYTNCTRTDETFSGSALISIPQDGRFFYGEEIDRKPRKTITFPFVKGYGTPGEFKGNTHLPLNGETRIHEVGLFDVTLADDFYESGEITYYLYRDGSLNGRYKFAMNVINSPPDKKTLFGFRTPSVDKPEWVNTGLLRKINLITAPAQGKRCIDRVVMNMKIKTAGEEDVLMVKLRDPGVPSRIWTHAEVKLTGFEGDGGILKLRLDFPPIILASGDRIWLEIITLNGADILTGGTDGGKIILKPAPFVESAPLYEAKAILPAMAEFTKAFEYPPWEFEKIPADFNNPHAFGGPFDTIFPAQAIKRILPYSRLAEFYIQYARPDNIKPDITIKKFDIPEHIPRWAYLQHKIQNFRYRILDWMAANQNSDGQLGGGWNDDTLILRGRLDMPLDGSMTALKIFNKIFEGLDSTKLFDDGYCQIYPIDRLHNGDFIRERYRGNIYNLGDPYFYRRSMRTAWRWDKPDKTPVNWGKGKPFLFDKNILEWYWGFNLPEEKFENSDNNEVNERLTIFASYLNDLVFHRYTEARVHTDSQIMFDERYIGSMIIGGSADQTVSVAWLKGGGEDLARWITKADGTSLECRIFSFDPLPRKVATRLFRIQSGTYKITLSEDINGNSGKELLVKNLKLKRFDTFSFTVPPSMPVILKVQQIKKERNIEPLPDLAVADYDCIRENDVLKVRVSNLGAAPSKKTAVILFDERDKKIAEIKLPKIKAPTDFVEKSKWIEFADIPNEGKLRIIVNPNFKQEEILKDNNEVIIN